MLICLLLKICPFSVIASLPRSESLPASFHIACVRKLCEVDECSCYGTCKNAKPKAPHRCRQSGFQRCSVCNLCFLRQNVADERQQRHRRTTVKEDRRLQSVLAAGVGFLERLQVDQFEEAVGGILRGHVAAGSRLFFRARAREAKSRKPVP